MTRAHPRGVWSHVTCVLLVARRELAGYFRTPLGYVVAVLFAVLQGVSFWYVLDALSDPTRPAPVGAVLFNHFGGSVLTSTVLVALVSALSMRLVAEDRRQGVWEILATAPVPEAAIITGKWLGGCAFYAFTWLPSALYPLVLRGLLPASQSLDLGPVGSSLLSILCVGSALMAVGLAMSAVTGNQLVAALATTVITMSWFLFGDLVHLSPRADIGPSWHSAALAHIDIRGHMDDMARGLVTLPALVLYASTAVFGLCLALVLALAGQRRTRELEARALATALVWICLVCVNILAARHPLEWDVTRAREHSLDEHTLAVLARVGELTVSSEPDPIIRVDVVRASLDSFAGIQDQVDRLLQRMARAQPALELWFLEPTLEPGRLVEIARDSAVPMENLRDGGVVVFRRGRSERSVDVLDMAEIAADDLGFGRLAAFRAEQAFARALAELVDPAMPTLCYTTSHGELPLEAPDSHGADDPARAMDWSAIGQRLVRDRYRLVRVERLESGVPGACRVLLVAGPSEPVTPAGSHAVYEFLARGGRLLLALDEPVSSGGRTERPRTGLELVLAGYGIEIAPTRVLDPATALDQTGAWFTTSGYGEHPITAGFSDRRLTAWLGPRAVFWHPPDAPDDVRGTVLVHSSARGRLESLDHPGDPDRAARPDEYAASGPLPVAVAVSNPASGARLVVFGSAYSLLPRLTRSHGSAGELLLIRSLDWLAGRDSRLEIPAKTPEHLRLVLGPSARRGAFLLCVVVMPGVLALIGLMVWWRRRRA